MDFPAVLVYRHSKEGSWVIGANGISFTGSYNNNRCRFYIDGNADATLYPSANWTLANTGLSSTSNGDLTVGSGSHLTIDTTDYNDGTTKRAALRRRFSTGSSRRAIRSSSRSSTRRAARGRIRRRRGWS